MKAPAANITNSPARREEVVDGLKDYSDKQKESNKQAAQQVMLYHKDHGGRIFNRAEAPGPKEGWRETPWQHPNNPQHAAPAEEPEVEANPEIEALRAECDRLGIKYDKRWGSQKLIKAITEAEEAEE